MRMPGARFNAIRQALTGGVGVSTSVKAFII
jgi:hypothetical protein